MVQTQDGQTIIYQPLQTMQATTAANEGVAAAPQQTIQIQSPCTYTIFDLISEHTLISGHLPPPPPPPILSLWRLLPEHIDIYVCWLCYCVASCNRYLMLINHPTDGATRGLTLRVRLLGQNLKKKGHVRDSVPRRGPQKKYTKTEMPQFFWACPYFFGENLYRSSIPRTKHRNNARNTGFSILLPVHTIKN